LTSENPFDIQRGFPRRRALFFIAYREPLGPFGERSTMHLAEIITSVIHAAGNLDVSGEDWLSTPGNVAIVLPNDDIALFDDNEDEQGVYQGHLLFKSRGREAIESAKECFRRMFADHGASVIYGLIPPDRRDVKLLLRWAGAKSRGERYTVHGLVELFVLSKDMWKGSLT